VWRSRVAGATSSSFWRSASDPSTSFQILSLLPSSFSWNAFREATEPSYLTPEILVTSPSTSSSLPSDDETDLCYLQLTPHGFISREMLRTIAEIDFDDDYSEPPMILASALRLRPLDPIPEEEEAHTELSTESTHTSVRQRTTLSIISEVDELYADEETATECSVPEPNL
jgi:hypothetical protein